MRPDELITTVIDVSACVENKRAALLAHQTQIAPDSPWMRLPLERLPEIWTQECFQLAVGPPGAGRTKPETDLFAGL